MGVKTRTHRLRGGKKEGLSKEEKRELGAMQKSPHATALIGDE